MRGGIAVVIVALGLASCAGPTPELGLPAEVTVLAQRRQEDPTGPLVSYLLQVDTENPTELVWEHLAGSRVMAASGNLCGADGFCAYPPAWVGEARLVVGMRPDEGQAARELAVLFGLRPEEAEALLGAPDVVVLTLAWCDGIPQRC